MEKVVFRSAEDFEKYRKKFGLSTEKCYKYMDTTSIGIVNHVVCLMQRNDSMNNLIVKAAENAFDNGFCFLYDCMTKSKYTDALEKGFSIEYYSNGEYLAGIVRYGDTEQEFTELTKVDIDRIADVIELDFYYEDEF